jgi:hypothetical protein
LEQLPDSSEKIEETQFVSFYSSFISRKVRFSFETYQLTGVKEHSVQACGCRKVMSLQNIARLVAA